MIKNLITILMSFVFSLISIEMFLNFNDIKKIINSEDNRKLSEIYNDLNKNEEIYKTTITPKYFLNNSLEKEIFPFAGISNSKTIHCNENGYWNIYESDRYGFNNPNQYWDKENLDYLIIGDSFGHSMCVYNKESIAGRLRENNKNVLNLSYTGIGPLIEFGIYKEYGENFKIRNLIWLYFEKNDLNDLRREVKNKILKNYLNNEYKQKLIYKQNQIDNSLNKFLDEKIKPRINSYKKYPIWLKIIKLTKLRKEIKNLVFDKNKIQEEIDSGTFEDFRKIMTLVKKSTDQKNINFYFVYIPAYERIKIKNGLNDNELYYYNKVISIISELNIKIIDLRNEIFLKENDLKSFYPFRAKGHFNSKGYMKISDLIKQKTN